jgi:DNA polymerase-3 subunit alpha
LAQNNTGYKNLIKLSTKSYLDGFYYKPRIDPELLNEHRDGLIVLTACIKGVLNSVPLTDKIREIFSDTENFYIELQINGLQDQVEFNKLALEYAAKYKLNYVLTNDSHYLNQENFDIYDLVRALQENKNIDDQTRKLRPTCNDFYIIPPNIMQQKAIDYLGDTIAKRAIQNTKIIADQCSVKLSNKMLLPKYSTGNRTQIDVLKELCFSGLKNKEKDYTDRLHYELEIIKKSDLESYFLIAWDFVKFAKQNKIRQGPGRGSSAGSLVCYSLGITDIDPIFHKLPFERFVNPERISMPDLDLDFEPDGREKIIDYIKKKCGENKVAAIVTFNSLKARAAMRDVARTYGIPFSVSDSYIKLLPHKVDSIDLALEDTQFRARYLSDKTFKKIVDKAKEIEGFVRQPGRHAAGIVISPIDITENVPLAVVKDNIVCQYDKDDLELIGMLKMDILGLRTLTVIQNTLNQLEHPDEIENEIKKLDDAKTLKMIHSGSNDGVFQLEGQGISQLGKTIGIHEFNDIVKLNALYRPGAMSGDMLQKFIENRKNPSKVKYIHPLLKDTLEDTNGILLFQETIMSMAKVLAGFSHSESDTLRKAVAKGKHELIDKMKNRFIDGCKQKNNIDKNTSEEIYSLLKECGYLFNRAHSVSYSTIGFYTAYLKAHYPYEYFSSLLSSVCMDKDRKPLYIQALKKNKIKLLKPHVNTSYSDFKILDKNGKRFILCGLNAIKDVVGDSIVKERLRGGLYKDLTDFIVRTNNRYVTAKTVQGLTKAGALDDLGFSRQQLLYMVDEWPKFKKIFIHNKTEPSLFQDEDDITLEIPSLNIDKSQLLGMEREVIGEYINEHPLDDFRDYIQEQTTWHKEDIDLLDTGQVLRFAGILKSVRKITTKKSTDMAFLSIEGIEILDQTITVFPEVYTNYVHLLIAGKPIVVLGRKNTYKGETTIVAIKIAHLDNKQLMQTEEHNDE